MVDFKTIRQALFKQGPADPAPSLPPAIDPPQSAEPVTPSQDKKPHHGSQTRQRVKSVNIALTPEERARVEDMAALAGLSLSSYARACVLGDHGPRAQRRPQVDIQHFAKAIAELNKIGSNVNQIAHAANLGNAIDRRLLARNADELSAAVAALLKAAGLQ